MKKTLLDIAPAMHAYVGEISCTELSDSVRADWTQEAAGRYRLTLRAHLETDIPAGSFDVRIRPAFVPDFHWAPHLTPQDENVIDMHVFRTPAIISRGEGRVLSILPAVEQLARPGVGRVYMDVDARAPVYALGITTTRVEGHVLYRRTDEAVLPAGEFCFSMLFLFSQDASVCENPFRPILSYYWRHFGSRQAERLAPLERLPSYVKRTYDWAFGAWRDRVWQEFELDGVRVGAPQFIVTVYQSRHYDRPFSIREHLSIWNQAWFCSLRTAMGLYRYARRIGDKRLLSHAQMTKELALRFPQEDGLFDSVVCVPDCWVEIDGQRYKKAGDWSQMYFGNSDRNPLSAPIATAPRHILDMSVTALAMVRWYRELEADARLIDYAIRYANRLVGLQDEAGYFPAWIQGDRILEELRQSPESAASATFLLELYAVTGNEAYRRAALRAVEVLLREVLPAGRWEDFETYWSCSRYGSETLLGKRCVRSGMYKQCTLSMFYLADALLACYETTREVRYLQAGARCLDELLMAQSSFQPEYMPLSVVGGFGVMNCDAELNDARQSLFADVIIRYGRLLDSEEYVQRGYAALRAAFSMMYCPENPEALRQWKLKWPFLGEDDYGFMMENYGHEGYADDLSRGIGEFTIYDWGNGAAAAAVMRVLSNDEDGGWTKMQAPSIASARAQIE